MQEKLTACSASLAWYTEVRRPWESDIYALAFVSLRDKALLPLGLGGEQVNGEWGEKKPTGLAAGGRVSALARVRARKRESAGRTKGERAVPLDASLRALRPFFMRAARAAAEGAAFYPLGRPFGHPPALAGRPDGRDDTAQRANCNKTKEEQEPGASRGFSKKKKKNETPPPAPHPARAHTPTHGRMLTQ